MRTKMIQIRHFCALLLVLSALAACSNESVLETAIPPIDNPNAIVGNPTFRLRVAPIEDYHVDTTRSSAPQDELETNDESSMSVTRHGSRPKTRSLGSIGEEEEEVIDNVWVLHYNGTDDTAELLTKEFITEIGDDYLIQPNLIGTEDIDLKETHTVCFLANTNNSSQFKDDTQIATLGDFKKSQSRVYANQFELTNNGVNLPMAAVYTGKINTAIKEIRLVRMVAKISFSFTIKTHDDHSFNPVAVQLQECKSTISFFEHSTEVTPTTKDDFLEYNMVKLKAGEEITWYIAENLKGEVENIKHPHQKGGLSTPDFASNIMIYGYYQKKKSNGETESFPVVYRVYLGQNNTSDFNVKRNHHYMISANIMDARTTDKRVVQPNIALYYFAEYNLNGVNQFITPKETEHPVGPFWQWGRNMPFFTHKLNRSPTSINVDDIRWWTDNNYFVNREAKLADTWQSVVQRQINIAPEEYIGNNINFMRELTGDPCPKGYHIPSSHEWKSITVSDSKDEYIEVKGIKGNYGAEYSPSGNIVYGIKFISQSTTNFLVAYRWEYVANSVKIRTRYLGQSGKKVTLADVSKPEYWEKNTAIDIERVFPTKAITDIASSSVSSYAYYWASDSNSSAVANVWRRTGSGKSSSELFYLAKTATLPIRCIRN